MKPTAGFIWSSKREHLEISGVDVYRTDGIQPTVNGTCSTLANQAQSPTGLCPLSVARLSQDYSPVF